jgi:hypothetical protein
VFLSVCCLSCSSADCWLYPLFFNCASSDCWFFMLLARVDLSLIVPLPPQLCPLLLLPGRGLEAGDRVRQAPCWRGSWCSCRW